MEIITPKPTKPPRMIIYGKHKIGKSSFGAGCPNPIFIQTEDGLENLDAEVKAFPLCKTFDEFVECMKFLISSKHEFKTLVIDSLDWLEHLIWADICRINKWEQLGQGPFGAGYKLALTYWDRIIKGLDKLNRDNKMLIVLIAHSKIVKFEDPERENYDRHTLDLHDKASELLCEYVDIIGFASERIATVESKEGFGKSIKAKSTGQRILCCTGKASYEAGNRYNLPDSVELNWSSLNTEIRKHYEKQRKAGENGGDKKGDSDDGKSPVGTGKGVETKIANGNLGEAKKLKEEQARIKEEEAAKAKKEKEYEKRDIADRKFYDELKTKRESTLTGN